ncbi:MAG: amidohydrolase family protein, partial [Fidelibacterota bacterium]
VVKSSDKKPDKGKMSQRDKRLKQLDDMMKDARAYLSAKDNGTLTGTDQRWEAMIPALNKEIPIFIHANRVLQIKAAIEWSARQDVKMVLVGGADSWRVTDLLRTNHIPVIFEHPLSTPIRRDESTDTKYAVPSLLFENGVKFCVSASSSTFEAPHQRNVPYEAAMAAAYGLPPEEALKSVTLYTAEILGVDDRVGSLDIGKDATMIVTDGDPLEITTHVELAFIQGKPVDLSDRHKVLYEKYRQKYLQK